MAPRPKHSTSFETRRGRRREVEISGKEISEGRLVKTMLEATLAEGGRARLGTGWLPDIPDFRDYTFQSSEVRQLFKAAGKMAEAQPASVDLRQFCSPVEDQGQIGSCTANAVVGLVEYFERRAKGEYLDASRRFLYKVTRKLYHFEGDSGAYIRGTMRSLRLFGVCPEEFWAYDVPKYDEEPPAFCYAFAQAYQAVKYYRIWDADPQNLLAQLKSSLAKGLPFAFGFTVYSSIWNPSVRATGDIPFPQPGERVDGGHAIMAIGYDDSRRRFVIRNSWGTSWGQQGYGSLPYEYVERGIADDFWVLASAEYVSLLGL